MTEENKDVKDVKNNKTHLFTLRLDDSEKKMLDTLKSDPYWVNIAEYLRATIKQLYETKTKIGE